MEEKRTVFHLIKFNTRARIGVQYFFKIAPGIEITPCNKNDKPLGGLRTFWKRYDVHNKVACIMTKL